MKKKEHWIVSTIVNTREALGCNKHGIFVGTVKNTKRM
jgi:hypothetical protein